MGKEQQSRTVQTLKMLSLSKKYSENQRYEAITMVADPMKLSPSVVPSIYRHTGIIKN